MLSLILSDKQVGTETYGEVVETEDDDGRQGCYHLDPPCGRHDGIRKRGMRSEALQVRELSQGLVSQQRKQCVVPYVSPRCEKARIM